LELWKKKKDDKDEIDSLLNILLKKMKPSTMVAYQQKKQRS